MAVNIFSKYIVLQLLYHKTPIHKTWLRNIPNSSKDMWNVDISDTMQFAVGTTDYMHNTTATSNVKQKKANVKG
jgi:hypothetical protein